MLVTIIRTGSRVGGWLRLQLKDHTRPNSSTWDLGFIEGKGKGGSGNRRGEERETEGVGREVLRTYIWMVRQSQIKLSPMDSGCMVAVALAIGI